MKTSKKLLVVAALAVAVAGVLVVKRIQTPAAPDLAEPVAAGQPLPRLVDVGAGKCIPCRLMAPILAELKKEYAGRFEVVFIDVWVNPDAGKPYSVEAIPTQIFFDATGKELFRHFGFFGKEDILAKWKELGVDLGGKPKSGIPTAPESPSTRSIPPVPAVTSASDQQVIAYYFHGTVRCETCLKIERQAKETIERKFGPDLETKRLIFKSLDYQEPENIHFLADYKLPYPSLVLVRQRSGKAEDWKRLDNTWDLVENPVKFEEYVEAQVNQFLGEQKTVEAGSGNAPAP